MASLREQKAAKKKEEILQSALILLEERGYHGTTMEDIASHLLMTKGSLYYYFKDKQDLVYQSQIKILEKSIENFQTVFNKDLTPSEKLAQAIIVHTEYLVSDKAGFELMVNPEEIFSEDQLREIYSLRDQYSACYDKLLAEGVEEGCFTLEDTKIVRNILLGAMNWVTQWYSPNGKMNKTELATSVASYLMKVVK